MRKLSQKEITYLKSLEDPSEGFYNIVMREMKNMSTIPVPIKEQVIGNYKSFTLFTQDQFQVQMFEGTDGMLVPEHVHPNVDSYEVPLSGGSLLLSVNGIYLEASESDKGVKLLHTDVHGGFSKGKARFLSIQYWLNDVKPRCITSDYSGKSLSVEHAQTIVSGDFIETKEDDITMNDTHSE